MTDDKRQLLYDPMPRKNAELPPRMPEADTIARLTAELADLRAISGNLAMAMGKKLDDTKARAEKAERELADALAAQTRRDAQMRAEGMRAAAVVAYDEEDESHPRPWENWGEYRNMVTAQTVAKEIRDALLALAAQPEEAANG